MFDGPGVGSKWVEIFCFVLPAAVFKDKLEKTLKMYFVMLHFLSIISRHSRTNGIDVKQTHKVRVLLHAPG